MYTKCTHFRVSMCFFTDVSYPLSKQMDVARCTCSQRHSEGMQRRVCWCLGNTLNAIGPTQVWLHHLSMLWRGPKCPIRSHSWIQNKQKQIYTDLRWYNLALRSRKSRRVKPNGWFVCLFVCLSVCWFGSFVVSHALLIAVELLTPVSCTTMSEWQRGQSRPCVASWWVGKRKMVSAWLPADQSEPRMVRQGLPWRPESYIKLLYEHSKGYNVTADKSKIDALNEVSIYWVANHAVTNNQITLLPIDSSASHSYKYHQISNIHQISYIIDDSWPGRVAFAFLLRRLKTPFSLFDSRTMKMVMVSKNGFLSLLFWSAIKSWARGFNCFFPQIFLMVPCGQTNRVTQSSFFCMDEFFMFLWLLYSILRPLCWEIAA